MRAARLVFLWLLATVLLALGSASAQQVDYSRQVDVAPTSVWLKGTCSIGGGTEWTGNLGILAPTSNLKKTAPQKSTFQGVVYVGSAITQIKLSMPRSRWTLR